MNDVKAATAVPLGSLAVTIDVRFRDAVEGDLPLLEWDGLWTAHRALIREAFARQQNGALRMVVGDVRGYPAAQAWIDFERFASEAAALVTAVRVAPGLRSLGLGAALMRAVHAAVADEGLRTIELEVEKWNEGAERFYTRLGYRRVGDVCARTDFITPDGKPSSFTLDMWRMRTTV